MPRPLVISSLCRRWTEPRLQATCTENGKDCACDSGDILADRQTHHTLTHRRTHYNTSQPLPRVKKQANMALARIVYSRYKSSAMYVIMRIIMLAASSGQRNVTFYRPSVRPSRRHTGTHRDSPGAACDAASVHFGPTVRRTDIYVNYYFTLTVNC